MRFKILTENFSKADNQKINMSGVLIEDLSFPIQIDFGDEMIGSMIPIIQGNEMFFEGNIEDKYLDLYPSVMISAHEDDITEENGIKIITRCKMIGFSLCSGPNVDKTIGTLREQISKQK